MLTIKIQHPILDKNNTNYLDKSSITYYINKDNLPNNKKDFKMELTKILTKMANEITNKVFQ